MRSAIAATFLFASSLATAGVAPVEVYTSADGSTGTVTFSVLFDKEPDFNTIGGAGPQADAFQFWVDSEGPSTLGEMHEASRPGATNAQGKSVIRGGDIHFGLGIPLIWIDPSDSGPVENGGWGPTKTYLAFNLTGKLLTFDVSLADLQEDDGVFWYHLMTFANGSMFCLNDPTVPLSSGVRYSNEDACWSPTQGVGTPSSSLLLLAGVFALVPLTRRPQFRSRTCLLTNRSI